MEKSSAPWSQEQIDNLNAFQLSGMFHPFTCGGDRGDEAHRAYAKEHGDPDEGLLVATEDGWVCPVCGYKQGWAHGGMADGSLVSRMTAEREKMSKIQGTLQWHMAQRANEETNNMNKERETNQEPDHWMVCILPSGNGEDFEAIDDNLRVAHIPCDTSLTTAGGRAWRFHPLVASSRLPKDTDDLPYLKVFEGSGHQLVKMDKDDAIFDELGIEWQPL